jgi:hypothetical protein
VFDQHGRRGLFVIGARPDIAVQHDGDALARPSQLCVKPGFLERGAVKGADRVRCDGALAADPG